MKQGKTLAALGTELQRQRSMRKDFVAETRSLEMTTTGCIFVRRSPCPCCREGGCIPRNENQGKPPAHSSYEGRRGCLAGVSGVAKKLLRGAGRQIHMAQSDIYQSLRRSHQPNEFCSEIFSSAVEEMRNQGRIHVPRLAPYSRNPVVAAGRESQNRARKIGT